MTTEASPQSVLGRAVAGILNSLRTDHRQRQSHRAAGSVLGSQGHVCCGPNWRVQQVSEETAGKGQSTQSRSSSVWAQLPTPGTQSGNDHGSRPHGHCPGPLPAGLGLGQADTRPKCWEAKQTPGRGRTGTCALLTGPPRPAAAATAPSTGSPRPQPARAPSRHCRGLSDCLCCPPSSRTFPLPSLHVPPASPALLVLEVLCVFLNKSTRLGAGKAKQGAMVTR